MIKTIFYGVFFCIIAAAIIFAGDHFYDTYHEPSTHEAVSASGSTPSLIKEEVKVVKLETSESTTLFNDSNIISKTSPHLLAGFDWSLPAKTKISKNSGLIAEDSHNPEVVNNRFIIVRWDETNPRPGQYDFSKLTATLNSMTSQQALIRLELNSSCEAPKWALPKLRQTRHKSLIYWDKSYMDLTKDYIQNFAQRFAANPQIIGVQLGLADGEFGEAPDSCNDYDNKQGWGEFWMSPDQRQEVEQNFGFNPDVFTEATIANIDIYANAFGKHKNKLAFTNIGTLFTYGEGSDPYNKNLKTVAKYALDKGLGNRDGGVERWMSYTDKIYGAVFKTMPDGSCLLDMDEQYMRNLKSRYWGTENEFYGNKDYVIRDMGPVKNHPYSFLVSSLRALQMRRNGITVSDMKEFTDPVYKTQAFMKYLSLTTGKQYEDTPDAFVLMGERYIIPYRLADQKDVACVADNKDSVKVRSFGRWLTESPQNTQVENQPAIKVTMPAEENYWYQGYYLPKGIDYEFFAREAKTFAFDLNDDLSKNRCSNGCEVEVKVSFKDTVKTTLHIQVAEGLSLPLETMGDNKIKTASFKINSKFDNQLQSSGASSDLSLFSEDKAIPLILIRINFLN